MVHDNSPTEVRAVSRGGRKHAETTSPLDVPTSQSAVDMAIDKILQFTESNIPTSDIVAAKEEFFQGYGKVFHEDECYDQRINYFLDILMFEKGFAFAGGNISVPYEHYVEQQQQPLIALNARHGLFKILKKDVRQIQVRDLLTKEKFLITARLQESFAILRKKEIFQGFIYEFDGHTFISKGMVIHPMSANSLIEKFLARAKKRVEPPSPDNMLSYLAKLNLKALRHERIDARKIYHELLNS